MRVGRGRVARGPRGGPCCAGEVAAWGAVGSGHICGSCGRLRSKFPQPGCLDTPKGEDGERGPPAAPSCEMSTGTWSTIGGVVGMRGLSAAVAGPVGDGAGESGTAGRSPTPGGGSDTRWLSTAVSSGVNSLSAGVLPAGEAGGWVSCAGKVSDGDAAWVSCAGSVGA